MSVCVFLAWAWLPSSGPPWQFPHLHLIILSAATFKPWLFHHSLPNCFASHSCSNSLSCSVLVMRVIFSSAVLFRALSNYRLLYLDHLPATITPWTVVFSASLQSLHFGPPAACLCLPSRLTLHPFKINSLKPAPASAFGSTKN